jgi:hypothetical protein
MASKEDVRARVPRGTKTLTQAFFAALDGIPGAQQKAVATAAVAAIRDELKAVRLKAKDAATKVKAKAKTLARTKSAPARKTKVAATAKRVPALASRKAAARKVATKKAPAKKAAAPKAAKAKTSGKTVVPAPAAAAA